MGLGGLTEVIELIVSELAINGVRVSADIPRTCYQGHRRRAFRPFGLWL